MNIGIFTNAYKPTISGVVNAVGLLKQGFTELGANPLVFAPSFPGYRVEEQGVHRFPSLNLFPKTNFPLAVPFSPRLYSLIEKSELSVIHAHHPYLLGELGAGYAKKFRIPLVYTFHTQFEQYTHYIPLLPRELAKKITRDSVVNYLKKCDLILCPAKSVLSLLEGYGVADKVKVVPNPVDLSVFTGEGGHAVRKRYNIAPEDKVLVFVGRLGQEKNLENLFKVFMKIREQVPRSRLLVVGEGPDEENLRVKARDYCSDGEILFSGRVEFHEIPPYYAASDLYVMPSTTEVNPLALLEAMASRLPIVAVAAHGASDTVSHGKDGFLVPEDSPEFVTCAVDLLNNPERQKEFGVNARESARQYHYREVAKTTLDTYRDLIAAYK